LCILLSSQCSALDESCYALIAVKRSWAFREANATFRFTSVHTALKVIHSRSSSWNGTVSRAHYMGGSILRNLFHVCRSRAIPSSNWVFSRHSFALWIVCGEDGFTLLKVQR
jgi:hypothetical protein